MAMPYASLSPAADRRASPATATASLLPFCRSSPYSPAGNGAGEEARMDGRWMARPLPFTAAQYEELEHQALIYKYLVAGVPVPPDLVLPIRRGIESLAARFYHNPLAIGYGSYLGKKVDPEPGRCRRTDGKKWRCAKEAASDSKYCERHMHRGRNRSRKPVETQLVPQSQPPPASAVPPLTIGSAFQSHSLYPAIGGHNGGGAGNNNNMPSTFSSAMGSPQLHMGNASSPYAALGTCKDFRYTGYGIRSLADEHSQLITEAINTTMENPWRLPPSQTSAFPLSSYPPQLGATTELGQNNNNNRISSAFSSAMGSPQLHMGNASPYAALGTCKDFRYTGYGIRSLADEHSQLITEAINTSMENPWRLPPSQTTAFPLSSYPSQLGASTELGHNNNNNSNSAAKAERQQQPSQVSFPGCGDFGGGGESVKQENQTLRPFFDEWPKARDSWSDLTDDNSNLASFSATQLSISIPMTSSDFSAASSQSPNGMLFASEMY